MRFCMYREKNVATAASNENVGVHYLSHVYYDTGLEKDCCSSNSDLDIMIVTTMQHHLYGSVHRSYILADSVDQLGWWSSLFLSL